MHRLHQLVPLERSFSMPPPLPTTPDRSGVIVNRLHIVCTAIKIVRIQTPSTP